MGRIKQGLDYFPLSTDFMHDRIVRRVMKREGDSAFTVLIYIMSYLYSGEGYYVRADTDFCDELSDQLFSTDNDTVRRVIRLFLEYGLFDSALYERYSILTSEDVQRQYLFITKRRSRHHICPDYCLLPERILMPQQGKMLQYPRILQRHPGILQQNSSHKKKRKRKERKHPP